MYMLVFWKWMNEFLEQLVRVLNKCLQQKSKGVWWACIIWPHKSAKLSWSSLLLGQLLIKPIPWSIWLIMLCLFPYQRVFYALASSCPSQRTRDFSKRRGLVACVLNEQHQRQTCFENILESICIEKNCT